MCNREVKFGVFWDFAKNHGADFIATGHYVVKDLLRADSSSRSSLSLYASRDYTRGSGAPTPVASQRLSVLRKSKDLSKDQSYFLWTLTQDDLVHTLFPVGHLNKTEVRKMALKYKIPVATKKDSQGVCFLGPLDMKDFLRHYIKSEKGNVINNAGKIIGTHDGAVFFTLGERHGFTLNNDEKRDKPLYVIAKDIERNTITVSATPENSFSSPIPGVGETGELHRTVLCSKINWINEVPEKDKKYKAQIRYHGELLDCKIVATGETCEITFDKNVLVDKGQSIVVFDGDVCLGGGVVE
jgi:tRNA-specific 2-thiouridylase